jgi:hypothetical protein
MIQLQRRFTRIRHDDADDRRTASRLSTHERELTAHRTAAALCREQPKVAPVKILVAMLTIAACAAGATAASAQDYPFCLNSCSYGSCTFTTLQQCQATASGLDGWCEANPNYRQQNSTVVSRNARSAKRRL